MGSIVVSPDHPKIERSLSLLLYNLFNMREESRVNMHIFFKYYNFTLQQWANALKNKNGVIA
jgi:hypothetical protein